MWVKSIHESTQLTYTTYNGIRNLNGRYAEYIGQILNLVKMSGKSFPYSNIPNALVDF